MAHTKDATGSVLRSLERQGLGWQVQPPPATPYPKGQCRGEDPSTMPIPAATRQYLDLSH